MAKNFSIQNMLDNNLVQKVELKALNSTQEAQALFVQNMQPPSIGAIKPSDSLRMV